ncbi:4'-phosphopantetheinyl transferase family protein [Bacillus cereus]|uniref:4'-phosphopantetheinyl transferase family protein n=1 Tax=Bacillus cereus TaxID=1396 RepID=UPI001374F9C4|nr:4'-phosphopantetheinyl transferase superfamily protein [Bacillus cereus]
MYEGICSEEQIYIYVVKLPSILSDENFRKLLFILNEEEKKTFFSYKVLFKKIEFMYGRVLIKKLLSDFLNIPIDKVILSKGDKGKLYLKDSTNNIDFNLSHTKGMLICGITKGGKIGVDIEKIDKEYYDIISSVFSPCEVKYINGLKTIDKNEGFYQLWTRKEAYLKCLGIGLNVDLTKITVPYGQYTKVADKFYYDTKKYKDFIISVVIEDINNKSIKYEFFESEKLDQALMKV